MIPPSDKGDFEHRRRVTIVSSPVLYVKLFILSDELKLVKPYADSNEER